MGIQTVRDPVPKVTVLLRSVQGRYRGRNWNPIRRHTVQVWETNSGSSTSTSVRKAMDRGREPVRVGVHLEGVCGEGDSFETSLNDPETVVRGGVVVRDGRVPGGGPRMKLRRDKVYQGTTLQDRTGFSHVHRPTNSAPRTNTYTSPPRTRPRPCVVGARRCVRVSSSTPTGVRQCPQEWTRRGISPSSFHSQ